MDASSYWDARASLTRAQFTSVHRLDGLKVVTVARPVIIIAVNGRHGTQLLQPGRVPRAVYATYARSTDGDNARTVIRDASRSLDRRRPTMGGERIVDIPVRRAVHDSG